MAQSLDSARFAHPPAEVRPAMLWFWNGRISDTLIDRQLAEMRGAGLAEVVIFPFETERLDPAFFSEGWFARVEHSLREAQRTGMHVWLFNGGGRVTPRRPELRPQAVYRRTVRAAAGASLDLRSAWPGTGPPPTPELPAPGPVSAQDVVGVAAVRGDSVVDLTESFRAGRAWPVPDGDWQIQYFARYYPPGFGAPGYLDLMNDEAARVFLETVPGEYYRRFPWAFGSVLRGFWDDEPVVTAWSGLVPWSDSLPAALRALGHTPAEALSAVFADLGRRGRIRRGAFWRAVANQFADAWYRQQGEWAARHGVAVVSNPQLDDAPPGRSVKSQGDPFKAHRWAQVPGADVVFRQFLPGDRTLLPRYAVSAAHLAGRPRVLAELFGGYDWRLTPQEARFVIGAMAARGVNLVVLHAYWSDSGLVRDPPSFDPSNPWWFAVGDLVTWTARVSDLALGHSAAPVALLVPTRAAEAWQDSPERERLDSAFSDIVARLEDVQASFDFLPEGALDGDSGLGVQAEPRIAQLLVGAQHYRVVIVPPARTLSRETARRLAAFARSGGTVIAWKPLPAEETRGEDSALAAAWPREGSRFHLLDSTAQLVETLIRTPFSAVREPGPPALRVLPLERGEDHVFLLFNESDRRIAIAPPFRLIGQPELWNPDDGSMRLPPTRWSPRFALTDVPLELEPFQVVGLVFRARPRSPKGPIGEPPTEDVVADATTGWRFRFAAGDTVWRATPLGSWTARDSTYSGTGVYEGTVEVKDDPRRPGDRYLLDLGRVRDVAEVELNGKPLGRRLWRPYRYDVTDLVRPGPNRITIRVTNTLANRKGTSLESGLLGPVIVIRVR